MSAVEIKGFVSIGIQGVMDELGPRFETGGSHKLTLTFNTSVMLNKHLHHGDVVDLMITSRSGMDDLIKAGLALSGTDVESVADECSNRASEVVQLVDSILAGGRLLEETHCCHARY
jgi:hypothetical protein